MSINYIRSEFVGNVLGVEGRFFQVVAEVVDGDTTHLCNQRFMASRAKDGHTFRVELRFDDNCKNGHSSFAMTGEEIDKHGRMVSCGCMHDTIAGVFPELASLTQWHLCSTDGPMHYIANTLFMASDLDYNGHAKGEANRFEDVAYVGNSPIGIKVKKSFAEFVSEAMRESSFEFILDKVEYRGTSDYKFGPKFSLAGYCDQWHECPFESETEATQWIEALTSPGIEVRFEKIPTSFSEGKQRELAHARDSAIWPDATDEQLCLPRAELQTVLEARLPQLIAEFKATMEACGFIYV